MEAPETTVQQYSSALLSFPWHYQTKQEIQTPLKRAIVTVYVAQYRFQARITVFKRRYAALCSRYTKNAIKHDL